jgi:hypothetical protein
LITIHTIYTTHLFSESGVSQAAEVAKQEVQHQHRLSEAYKVSAIFVVTNRPRSSTHLAMRDISKLDFIYEIIVWHESSSSSVPLQFWQDCPTELHGKPVVYLPQPKPRQELAKYDACAEHARKESNVCYFQLPQRDASGYMQSLWASFLRSPDVLHTAVSASTYYLDQASRESVAADRLHAFPARQVCCASPDASLIVAHIYGAGAHVP